LKKLMILIFLIISFETLIAQVNTEAYRQNSKHIWDFSLNTSFALKKGNSEQLSTNNTARIDFKYNPYYSFLVGNFTWSKTSDVLDTSKAFSYLCLGRNFFVKWFSIENFEQIQYDKFLNLNFRGLVGITFRFRLINLRNKLQSLKLFLVPGFMIEREVLDKSKILLSEQEISDKIRFTTYLSFFYSVNPQLSISSTTYFQPAIEDFYDFRILSNSKLLIKIIKHLSFSFSIDFRYDNQPPNLKDKEKMKKYDLGILNGFEITF